MLWYEGEIKNAVNEVKSTGSPLLVFVQGCDHLSKEYESCLNKITGLKKGSYVAVKLACDSTAFQQFKQIYVKVPIPSLFFIQNNGIPFDVVAIDKISEVKGAITKTVTKLNDKFEKEYRNAVNESTKKSLENPPEKTLEHAKNTGFKIIDGSKGELQQRLNDIRAFPRFLLINSSSNPDPDPVSVPLVHPPKTHSARIQFRLPNCDTPSWEFPDLSTLKDVRDYITENISLPPHFRFMRTYPRTMITQQDECKTLLELSLTPNATLIVVPFKVEDKNVQANSSDVTPRYFFYSFLSALLLPLFNFFNFFKKHIFGERMAVDRDESGPTSSPPVIRNDRGSRKIASNVHGFKFDRDDSDGEHPDNGNSTQQSYHKK